MNDLTFFINEDLVPAIFEVADRAFPEHDFRRYSGGWRSKTYLDGTPHKNRQDKTVIPKKYCGLIIEQGGEQLSLIDYVKRRDGVETIDAVKILADVAG